MRNSLATICLCLAVLVGGCASNVTSEVTRFHHLPMPSGEKVAIVPMDDAKIGSLEFANYATMVARELEQLGYEVLESGEPDIYARIDYAVGQPVTRVQPRPRAYVHYHFALGRYHPYYFGAHWDEPLIYAEPVYPRTLDLVMETDEGETVFEGHVRSLGYEESINRVMPYLVAAMFENFPGESGVTKIVTIRKDEDSRVY